MVHEYIPWEIILILNYLPPFSHRATLESKEFAFLLCVGLLLKEGICCPRCIFFPLRVNPIFEGFYCPGRQTKRKLLCPPTKGEGGLISFIGTSQRAD